MSASILFLSNGHGEDLNGSRILAALQRQYPQVSCLALPLVGQGQAYRRLGVPLIAPTQTLPSGGMIYTHPLNWLKDLGGGLCQLTYGQIRALRSCSSGLKGCAAIGDIVPLFFAYFSGQPFVAFLVSTSSYYEGRLQLPALTKFFLRSPQCRGIFTRDALTAADLQSRGFCQAQFLGYPIMDGLESRGQTLPWQGEKGKIALLPGSRLPEALENLALELQLCQALQAQRPLHFAAALVPSITAQHLKALAERHHWHYQEPGFLQQGNCRVFCAWDSFNDILATCDLVLGMAGTAVEQAVGLGKPVIQIPGEGPQFTYAFAEAQMRLLGPGVITLPPSVPLVQVLPQAVTLILRILADGEFLNFCSRQGQERVGPPGGSGAIADALYTLLLAGE